MDGLKVGAACNARHRSKSAIELRLKERLLGRNGWLRASGLDSHTD